MQQVEKCVPYALFYLKSCLRIVMSMIYRNDWSVCLCVWVCVCVLRTVCDVTYHNVSQRTVHLIPEQVTCFGLSKLLVLLLSLSAYSYSISPSFSLRAPFYDTLPLPTAPSHWTVYLQLPFILMIIHYSDNWAWLPTYGYIEPQLTNNPDYIPGDFQEQNYCTGKCTVNTLT
jgi:hypothetical protein